MTKTGVYVIENNANGKVYVGSTTDFSRRFSTHKRLLGAGTHDNPHLQSAWAAYGESAFSFKRLLLCKAEDLLMYEQRAMDVYSAADRRFGYNHLPVAGSRLGSRHSAETRKKISSSVPRGEAHMYFGKRLSDAAYAAAAAKKKEFGIPDEVKLKMSASKKGIPKSEEHKRKISIANKGRALSEDSIERMKATKRRNHIARAVARYSELSDWLAGYLRSCGHDVTEDQMKEINEKIFTARPKSLPVDYYSVALPSA